MATRTTEIATKNYENGIDKKSFEKGVNAVKISPMAEAIKQKDRFEKNTLAKETELIKALEKVDKIKMQDSAIAAFSKLESKVIEAVTSGKWNANNVLGAARAAHNITLNMPIGTYKQSYERHKAAQDAIKKFYGKK